MAKTMTVKQLAARLEEIIKEGHGNAPVLNQNLCPAYVKVEGVIYEYVGPSEYDNHLYRRTDLEGETVII